jgi:Coenzyme PQQ synthesis protein D (PqqD)
MSQPESIDLLTKVVRSPEQTSGEIDGQVVMLSVESGHYYSMNEQGSRIWELLGAPHVVSDLIDRLTAEFEVERPQCEAEVLSFLERLRKDGLLQVVRSAG